MPRIVAVEDIDESLENGKCSPHCSNTRRIHEIRELKAQASSLISSNEGRFSPPNVSMRESILLQTRRREMLSQITAELNFDFPRSTDPNNGYCSSGKNGEAVFRNGVDRICLFNLSRCPMRDTCELTFIHLNIADRMHISMSN